MKNIEYILLGFGIILVFFLGIVFINNPLEINTNKSTLLTMSQILATVFAITISLTILGFQYISQSLSIRSIKTYIVHPYFLLLIFFYFITIVGIIIFSLYNINSLKILQVDISSTYIFTLLFIFCMVYLISYFFFIPNNIYPSKVIERIGNKIVKTPSKNIIKDENLLILKDILLRAIRNNDNDLFILGLGYMVQSHINSISPTIEEIYKDNAMMQQLVELHRPNNNSKIENMVNSINQIDSSFREAYYMELYEEISKNGTYLFLNHFVTELSKLFPYIFRLHISSAKNYKYLFKEIGIDLVNDHGYSFANAYIDSLENLINNELNSLIELIQNTTLIGSGSIFNTINTVFMQVIKKSIRNSSRYERNETNHIFIVNNLKGILATTIVNLLEEVSEESKTEDKSIGFKKEYIWRIWGYLGEIQEYSVNCNILNISFLGSYGDLLDPHDRCKLIKSLIEFYIGEEVLGERIGEEKVIKILEIYSDSCAKSMKKGCTSGEFELFRAAQCLIENYPIFSILIINYLIESLESLIGNMQEFKTIIKAVIHLNNLNDMIIDSANKEHKKIRKMIRELFRKYDIRIDGYDKIRIKDKYYGYFTDEFW